MADGSAWRPLRVAAFSSVDLSLKKGNALHVRGILDALAARGHRLHLFTPRPASTAPPLSVFRVPVPVIRWRVLGPWSFEILGGILLLAHCVRRRPDLIYARLDLYTFSPALIARLLRIPLAVEVNSSIPDALAIRGRRSVLRIAEACERFTVRSAAAVLAMAAPLGEKVAARARIDAARVHVIPIATQLPEASDPVATRAHAGVDPGVFLVGFAGDLALLQGVDILIDAMLRLEDPEVRLWVIGAGEEEAALKDRAAALANRARFAGGVPREEADRLLAACQVLVAPYRRSHFERVVGDWGQTSKVVAYLAASRPILVADIPAFRWLEEAGVGERFGSDDADALAAAIVRWARAWRAAGSPLREWPWAHPGPGRRYVEEGHTWEHAALRTEEVLDGIATSAGRRRKSRGR